MWDYICASTVGDRYLENSENQGGFKLKRTAKGYKYRIVPVGSEAIGLYRKKPLQFLYNSFQLIEQTKDERAASLLFQCLSIAVQQ